jgi:hypothetical protein
LKDKRFYARKFLLESGDKIMRPVLKQHDKAEGKKQEQGYPKQTA